MMAAPSAPGVRGPGRPVLALPRYPPLGGCWPASSGPCWCGLRRRLLRAPAGAPARGTVFLDGDVLPGRAGAAADPDLARRLAGRGAGAAARAGGGAGRGGAAAVGGARRDARRRSSATARPRREEIRKAVQAALPPARRPDLRAGAPRAALAGCRRSCELRRGRAAAHAAAPRPRRRRRPRRRPRRPAAAKPRAEPEPEAEPALPLLPEAEAPSRPDWPDLIRALDFPRDADDREGFRALRTALRHHGLAQMLQAAEDVLNLCRRRASSWTTSGRARRRRAPGAASSPARRGAEVAGVGGIRDAARARGGARR